MKRDQKILLRVTGEDVAVKNEFFACCHSLLIAVSCGLEGDDPHLIAAKLIITLSGEILRDLRAMETPAFIEFPSATKTRAHAV